MRIIIASPGRELCDALKQTLLDAGAAEQVETLYDSAQLLSSLTDEAPDIVLLDERLPGSGQMNLVLLLQKHKTAHIVIRTDSPDANEYLDAGVPDAFLVMPFKPSELLETVRLSAKTSAMQEFLFDGIRISPAEHLLGGTVRLTDKEIELAKEATVSRYVPAIEDLRILQSLNEKLKAAGAASVIRYAEHFGYEVVSING